MSVRKRCGAAPPEALGVHTAVRIGGLFANGTFIVVVFRLHPRATTGTSDVGWVRPARSPAPERAASLVLMAGWGLQLWSLARPARRPRSIAARAGAIVAGALVGASVRLAMTAQDALGPAWRTSVTGTGLTALATGGPYRLIRHPVYTAMIGVLTANLLIGHDRAAVAGAMLGIAGLEIQVRVIEEPVLRSAYGEVYGRYSATAGRFVPFLGRLGRRRD